MYRLMQRMVSSLDLPSAILRAAKAWVASWVRSRLMAIMCSARLAWRSQPRLRRVPAGLARGGRERCDAAEHRPGGLGAKALGVTAGGD
jgi:hypothetical protein